MKTIGLTLSFLALTILLISCGSPIPTFRQDNAYQLLVKQTDWGPRVPGSEAHQAEIQFLRQYLQTRASAVVLDSFIFIDTILGRPLRLTNVIGRFNPENRRRILLGAHFDSRPRSDMDLDSLKRDRPLLGANDGASGVAVLLELADILGKHRPRLGVDLAFFDGEDWGESGHLDYYCLGARHLAAQLVPGSYEYVIIVDMVGDRNQEIYKEEYSLQGGKPVVDLIWELAEQLKIQTFHPAVKNSIFDDHIPFLRAGIPAIVIIDFDYPYWHTTADTPDKCSPESLANVGKILVALLYR